MIIPHARTFTDVFTRLRLLMKLAVPVEQLRWQGRDVSDDPSARCYELQNVVFELNLNGNERLAHWRDDIKPNLPWADDHFEERVGGEPLNPGVQWVNWPWHTSADTFREGQQFNHTYMERLWPRYARYTDDGRMPRQAGIARRDNGHSPRRGIHHWLGDLESVAELLVRDPHTRQAWIPLFFPEDTGYGDGGRKPCTLGYQFTMRNNRLSIWYPLRSCDLVRHFPDDCYMAVRLLLWMLDICRDIGDDEWKNVVPGTYAMHCTSLHIFENDRRTL